jgi:hypothetical protein
MSRSRRRMRRRRKRVSRRNHYNKVSITRCCEEINNAPSHSTGAEEDPAARLP